MFAASCTPVKIIETITIDSTGKPVKTKVKYYQQTNGYSSQRADVHIITTPLFYNRVPIMVPVPLYRAPIIRGRGRGSYGFRHRH